MNRATTAEMVIDTPAGRMPLVASPEQVAPMLGKTGHAVRDDCAAGRIQTLQRGGGSGSWYRIPVTKLLDDLGVPYEIVSANPSEPVAC
jgi:hypothetical protein